MIRRISWLFVLAALAASSSGCASGGSYADPDELLQPNVDDWMRWRDQDPSVADYAIKDTQVKDPDIIRHRIESLALEYPGHVPTLMANAIVAYDSKMPEQAQQYLDRVFAIRPAHPDAGILRARIAIDEGNTGLARRVVEEQIHLSPSHAGPRETYASVLFVTGRYDEARSALDAASALGAPVWRVSYNRGLIEEAAGETERAKTFYEITVRTNPDFAPAQERLKALKLIERRR